MFLTGPGLTASRLPAANKVLPALTAVVSIGLLAGLIAPAPAGATTASRDGLPADRETAPGTVEIARIEVPVPQG